MQYNKIELKGNWKEGYALDIHTIKSEYIGDDMWGHPMFYTTYSEIGECIKKIKYRRDLSQIDSLVNVVTNFLMNDWKIVDQIDLIIPAPPSKQREIQHVFLLVEDIAHRLKKAFCLDYFQKLSNIEVKNLNNDEKRIQMQLKKHRTLSKKANILIIDDLYDSGVTLTSMCEELLKEQNMGNLYVLTMTKTRKG